MRTFPAVLLLGILHGQFTPLSAQEPTRPPEGDRVFVRRTPPPPGQMFEGQIQVITTRRAKLGVSLDLRPREDDSLGARIQSVTPNGPAARAGIRSGDVITSLNRTAVTMPLPSMARDVSSSGIRLLELMADVKPGDTLAIEFLRGSQRRNASVIAGEEPTLTWRGPYGSFGYAFGADDPAAAEARRRYTVQFDADPGALEGIFRLDSMKVRTPMRIPAPIYTLGTPLANLELAPMNPGLGKYFGTDEGILVVNLPPDSRLGLKPGDVVLSVDGRTLMGPAHLVRVLRSYGEGETFKLRIVRMKKREVVTGQVAD